MADNVCKAVISAYKCEADHANNVTNLSGSRFSREVLENCALFLDIKINNVGTILTNKKQIADRIILKIESNFNTICRECESPYRNRFKAEPYPLLTCHSCFQGSHDCPGMKEKIESLNKLQTVIGIVWLCHDCLPLNDVARTYSKATTTSKSTADKSSAKQQTEKVKEPGSKIPANVEVVDGEQAEYVHPPRILPNQRTDICKKYIHGNCPHELTGHRMVNGASCGKPHPRMCFRYRKYGTEEKRGCTKGKECDWFHPIICKSSL